MMVRRASEICLALTVCCSNLVFTADWEMHSCKQQQLRQQVEVRRWRTGLSSLWSSHLEAPLEVLELKHSGLEALSQSST